MRTLEEFTATLEASQPPADFDPYEQALWHAGKGNWDKAHQLVQDLNDRKAAHIHAFLHRQEGDLSNAAYWYARAGVSMPRVDIGAEWKELVTAIH